MAGSPPTLTEILDNVGSTTVSARIKDIVDNFFLSNPFAARLLQRDHVKEDGGKDIRQPLIYEKLPGGSYSGLDTFDISKREVLTELVFNWKQYYVDITVDGLSMLQNAGGKKIFDLVSFQMDLAEMTFAELIGVDLQGDGTGNSNKAITGLRAACDNGDTVASYGGITRSSTANTPGYAVRGNINTTGGALTLPLVNTEMGTATIGKEKPDLGLTTQTLWNKLWERVQPAQRFNAGNAGSKIAEAGFDSIRLNSCDFVVDSHVASGRLWLLNTKWFKLIIHSQRMLTPTGWKYPVDQDAAIQQLLWAGELVCQSPRLQSLMTGLT